MTIWAAQNFDEYYLYTGDEKFLKERVSVFQRDGKRDKVAVDGKKREAVSATFVFS